MIARIHKGWSVWATLAGLALVFVGERVLAGFDVERLVVAGLGVAAIAAALAVRVSEMSGSDARNKSVRTLLAVCTGGVVVALLLYGLQAYHFTADADDRIRGVLWVAWPLVLAISVLPLVAIELAALSAVHTANYEIRRVNRAFERGLSLALLLGVVFLANFLADQHEWKADLSTGKKAVATDATRRLVRELSKPVEVVLFYPSANDVAEALDTYFDSLRGLNDMITVRRVDQALAGKTASDAGVNENGYVGLSHEKTHEKIRLGLTLRGARSALRSFDANFAKALIKVSRSQSIAYFTAGHGERSTSPPSDDKRSSLRLLKQRLRTNRFEVKPLGVAEGLANEVPKDASIVFIMGPEKPFLPEEIATLKRALERGVRILIALESEREGDPLDDLLAALGLKFDKTTLINERAYVRVTGTSADSQYIFSNRYSSHASVTTMTRHSNRLATLFAHTGSIEKQAETPPGYRVDMVLTALDATFGDKDGDLKFDEGDEQKKAFGLSAAVTRTASTSSGDETRVFVHADVDTFTDDYGKFQGNPYLLADIVYWLRDVKEPVLPTVSEEDVRIVHKRDEDAWWFYSTMLGLPGLVVLVGLFAGRRRRTA